MPTPRYGLAAVLGADGKIYAIGGNYTSVSDAGPSVVVQQYDPATNMWQACPALPVGRSDVAAAVDGSGMIYAIGGFDGTTFQTLGSVAAWQPGTPSWSTLADPMTTARSEHVSAAMPDGNIYALGGEHGVATDELGALEYYNSGWHTLAAMPTPRKMLAAASIGPRLYAIGGNRWVSAGISYMSMVEAFDTGTHAWSQVTSLPTGRFDHAAIAAGGKIYVIGGRTEDTNAITATATVYTPDP
jgi:N-acetylneuraminic acid mutarotase